MKSRVVVVRKASKKLILGYALYIVLLGGLTVEVLASLDKSWQVNEKEEESIPVTATKAIETTNTLTNTANENFQISPKKEYENMPKDIEGHKVIGKLEIPKINVSAYILEETNKETLNLSVTKLCGPNINEVGNFCITGHNYNRDNMFGKLRKLEIGDEIMLTDTYEQMIKYQVDEILKINPKEVSALNQETEGERRVSLITCTIGALNRIVVKASEIYD